MVLSYIQSLQKPVGFSNVWHFGCRIVVSDKTFCCPSMNQTDPEEGGVKCCDAKMFGTMNYTVKNVLTMYGLLVISIMSIVASPCSPINRNLKKSWMERRQRKCQIRHKRNNHQSNHQSEEYSIYNEKELTYSITAQPVTLKDKNHRKWD